jgi:hypothetical protein
MLSVLTTKKMKGNTYVNWFYSGIPQGIHLSKHNVLQDKYIQILFGN